MCQSLSMIMHTFLTQISLELQSQVQDLKDMIATLTNKVSLNPQTTTTTTNYLIVNNLNQLVPLSAKEEGMKLHSEEATCCPFKSANKERSESPIEEEERMNEEEEKE